MCQVIGVFTTLSYNVFSWTRATALVIKSQALIPLGHGCNTFVVHICTNGSVVKRLYLQYRINTVGYYEASPHKCI